MVLISLSATHGQADGAVRAVAVLSWADTLGPVRLFLGSFSCLAVWVRRLTMLLHARLAIMVGGVVVRLVMLWPNVRDGV